jgi:hypothetical protein
MAVQAMRAAAAPIATAMTSELCQPKATLARPETTEPSICPAMMAKSMRPIITCRSMIA